MQGEGTTIVLLQTKAVPIELPVNNDIDAKYNKKPLNSQETGRMTPFLKRFPLPLQWD